MKSKDEMIKEIVENVENWDREGLVKAVQNQMKYGLEYLEYNMVAEIRKENFS